MKQRFACFVKWLGGLSFRSGVAVAVVCVTCYAISFGQMLLPISLGAKGVLWFIFFWTCQDKPVRCDSYPREIRCRPFASCFQIPFRQPLRVMRQIR